MKNEFKVNVLGQVCFPEFKLIESWKRNIFQK